MIGRGICGVKIEEDGYMVGNVGRARTPASYLAVQLGRLLDAEIEMRTAP
jgi:hypothetical protein